MAVTNDGTPYVEPGDAISAYPTVSQELAAVIDSLRTMIPVGAIFPYAGKVAPEGYLMCDGKAYTRTDFYDLYQVMAEWVTEWGGFPGGNSAQFYVPDMRGRSPVGQHSLSDPVLGYPINLGTRRGDYRVKSHRHVVTDSAYSAVNQGTYNAGTPDEWTGWSGQPLIPSDVASGGTAPHQVHRINLPLGTNVDPPNDTKRTWVAYDTSEFVPAGLAAHGTSHFTPQTVVNFIVYTGTTTTGKNPVPGVELPAVTTRMMIEARLEEAGIGEEEIEMLRAQLKELETADA